jgi:hypothetical protein
LSDNSTKVDVHGVEILLRGTYKGIDFTDEVINALVERYDPVNMHEAQLNLGHPWDDGPATHGAVERIYYQAPALMADLCRVPEDLAKEMVQGGAYPYRSIEIDLEFVETDDEDGYKLIPKYLTGLALLGTSPPAVKGMKKVTPEQIHKPQYMSVVGFAATDNWLHLTQERGVQTLQLSSIQKEEPAMAETGKNVQEETVSLSAFNTMQARMAELEQRDKEREAKLAEAEAVKVALEAEKLELSGKVDGLTKTTEALQSEAAANRQKARLRDAELFMEKLRADKGGTVAPLANAGVVELMAMLDGFSDDWTLKLSDDSTVNLGDALRNVLSALPAFEGHIEMTPVDEKGEVHLSERQLELAKMAGVPPEEYAKRLPNKQRGGA